MPIPTDSAELRARAWRFGHILLDVARLAPAREQVDMINISTAELAESLMESDRESTSYTPDDLEAYFEALVMRAEVRPQELAATCEIDQVRSTLVKLG